MTLRPDDFNPASSARAKRQSRKRGAARGNAVNVRNHIYKKWKEEAERKQREQSTESREPSGG